MVDIVTGEVKGRHDGLMYYTLGQRQGLGIGGSGSGEPWFVADKDLTNNILYVVQGDHPCLYSTGLVASGMNWIAGQDAMPKDAYTCTAKFRYRQPDQEVTITPREDGTVHVAFAKPQKRSRRAKPLSSTKGTNALAAERSKRRIKFLINPLA